MSALSLFETMLAKEARKRSDCRGKLLDCSFEIGWGLQCGLSGNQAPQAVTLRPEILRETADLATFRYRRGKSCLT